MQQYHSLAELAAKIKRSLAEHPEDFAGREPLWMERDRLYRALVAHEAVR